MVLIDTGDTLYSTLSTYLPTGGADGGSYIKDPRAIDPDVVVTSLGKAPVTNTTDSSHDEVVTVKETPEKEKFTSIKEEHSVKSESHP